MLIKVLGKKCRNNGERVEEQGSALLSTLEPVQWGLKSMGGAIGRQKEPK